MTTFQEGLLRKIFRTNQRKPNGQMPNPSAKQLIIIDALDEFEGEKKFGRHGDLKPENILFFNTPNLLNITDLGLGKFHRRESRASEYHNPLTSRQLCESLETRYRPPPENRRKVL